MSGIDAQDWIVAGVCFVLGWVACRGWDALVDMLFGAVDGARSILGGVLAIVGAIAIAVLVGYLITH